MTRIGAIACVSGILCLALLTSKLDTQAGIYPSPESEKAEGIAAMVARTAEDQCGEPAIKTSRGLRCARDINPALIADAGVVR